MKKLSLLSVFTLTLFLVMNISSCSQEENAINEFNSPVVKTQVEANLLLVNYLELQDDEYVLNISQVEAVDLGVQPEFFMNTLNEIQKTNESIKEIKKEPNHELQLTDPKIALKVDQFAANKVSLRGAPTGTLRTNGQEEARMTGLWAPSGTKGIKFTCRANAAITPAFVCKTYSSALWQSKTAVGLIGTNTIVEVPLYVSNSHIGVAFQTTDSNGGSANYEGY